MFERDNKIDTLKGIAIFLVVLGHVVAWCIFGGMQTQDERNAMPFNAIALWKIIYSFHMPLFLFLSGYLFVNPNKKYNVNHIFKRCTTYMIPFFSMGILLALWREQMFQGYWYFRTLAEFTLILFLLNSISSKLPFTPPSWITFIVFVIIFKTSTHLIATGSIIDDIVDIDHLNNSIYFGMGWLFRIYKEKMDKFIVNQYAMLASLIGAFFCIINAYEGRIAPLIWIVLMINIADILSKNNLNQYMNKIGKETKFIYLIHPFLGVKLSIIGYYLMGIDNNGFMTNFILQLLLTIPISCLMIFICIRISRFIKLQHFSSFILFGEWDYINDIVCKKKK